MLPGPRWSPSVPVVEFLAVWIRRGVKSLGLVSDIPDLPLDEVAEWKAGRWRRCRWTSNGWGWCVRKTFSSVVAWFQFFHTKLDGVVCIHTRHRKLNQIKVSLWLTKAGGLWNIFGLSSRDATSGIRIRFAPFRGSSVLCSHWLKVVLRFTWSLSVVFPTTFFWHSELSLALNQFVVRRDFHS